MDAESEDEDYIDDYVIDRLDDLQEETLVEQSKSKDDLESSRRRKKFVPNFDIPGVVKVTFNEVSQTSIGIKIGIDLTGLHPWKLVKRELLLDNLAVFGDDSTLAPFKSDIESYEEDEILIGYIFDETRDFDEFYVCLTVEAKTRCEVQAARVLKKQLRKLDKCIHKSSRPWKSLGSETEVDEFTVVDSRPLIELEITVNLPREVEPKQFSKRDPDDIKDGYTELVSNVKYDNVYKMRIDSASQAIPEKCSSEVQTVPTFPQNVWTQCSLEEIQESLAADIKARKEKKEKKEKQKGKAELKKAKSVEEDPYLEKVCEGLRRVMPEMLSVVQFNGVIDIYNPDYPSLNVDEDWEDEMEELYFEEVNCFASISTKSKYVSSVSWHPLDSNIMAVAYSHTTYAIVKVKECTDEVHRDVHDDNLVLIWDLRDTISPKLYLETLREVKTLSFCPYSEDLLVGGCVNGQIVVWDLAGKLDLKEKFEIPSEAKQKMAIMSEYYMSWMKKVDKKRIQKPCVTSILEHSHKNTVTDITWLSPYYEIGNNGVLTMLNEDAEKSLQFFSISLDGNLLVWSLKTPKTPIDEKIPSKRVNITLSDLGLKPSKYSSLDKKLQPVYKILIAENGSISKFALTTMSFKQPNINYVPVAAKDRKYKIEVEPSEEGVITPNIWLGSMYGEVLKVTWSGHILNSVEDDNEKCGFEFKTSVHDGPVVCCSRNPFLKDIVATVGGKVFAIWSEAFPEHPLFWRKMGYYMTYTMWSPHLASQIFFTTATGDIDIWDFLHRSDAPVESQKITGSLLTGIYTHRVPADESVVVIANSEGFLKLFRLSESMVAKSEAKSEAAKEFFARQLKAKQCHKDWEADWYKKNEERLRAEKEAEEKRKAAEKAAELKAKRERGRRVFHADKSKEVKKEEPDIRDRWKRLQLKHAFRIIEENKQIRKVDLLKLEAPLRELEAQRIARHEKLLEVMKRQNAIFSETVALLFPEVVVKSQEKIHETPAEELEATRKKVLEDYEKISSTAKKYIEENPYVYEFNWADTLMRAKQRKRETYPLRRMRQNGDDDKQEEDKQDVSNDREQSTVHFKL